MVTFGLAKEVVVNTILGHTFQIKYGMVGVEAENMVTIHVFGFSLPVINESSIQDVDYLLHATE